MVYHIILNARLFIKLRISFPLTVNYIYVQYSGTYRLYGYFKTEGKFLYLLAKILILNKIENSAYFFRDYRSFFFWGVRGKKYGIINSRL